MKKQFFYIDEVINQDNKILSEIRSNSYQVCILDSQIPFKVVAWRKSLGSKARAHTLHGASPWPCVLDPYRRHIQENGTAWHQLEGTHEPGLLFPGIRIEPAPGKASLFPSPCIFTYIAMSTDFHDDTFSTKYQHTEHFEGTCYVSKENESNMTKDGEFLKF